MPGSSSSNNNINIGASSPPQPLPPPRPSLRLATASCLRHRGLRAAWCRACFGDRAPWKGLWEAAFADAEGEEGDEGQREEISSVDRSPFVVRLASSLAAREKVQAEVCGPRCLGPGCLVAATELDAALGGGGGGRGPLRVALAALLADVEDREGGGGSVEGEEEPKLSPHPLLLRHGPAASLPPAPSPRFVPLPSQLEAIREIDAALSSGARFVSISSASEEEKAGATGGGKTTVAAAAARAFLLRARGRDSSDGFGLSVTTCWDSAFWLDARGLEGGDESDETSPSAAVAEDDDDEYPAASAFRALLVILGGSAVPGTPDRDRVLLRARSIFGGERSGGYGGGGGAAARRSAGLFVRLIGSGSESRRRRGLLAALLELLDAARGLSVVVIGGTNGLIVPDAAVVVRSPSPEEAQLFLRETSSRAPACSESELLPLLPPPPSSLRDVRVLRAAAGLGISPLELADDAAAAADSPRRSLFLLLTRRAPAPLLLRLSRLSSALLRGRGGSFTVFAASVVFNCDFEKALGLLKELQELGLAHPLGEGGEEEVSEATAAKALPSSSSSWSLSSLAAAVGQDLSERLGSNASLSTLARIAEAASAALETALVFAREGKNERSGDSSSNDDLKRTACSSTISGGHALASHWISKERALFLSASLLAKKLCSESNEKERREEEKQPQNQKDTQTVALSSVALFSLSTLLWNGGDKLLPGLLGFGVHARLAINVEEAATPGRAGEGFRAHAARAAWALGASLSSRGRWQEARDPLLRALAVSDALPESGEGGRHRIVSWIARVEYKVKGDLSSAADFYARAAARANTNTKKSVSASSSSSSPSSLEANEFSSSPSTSSTPSSPRSPHDPLALEQEAEALEGAAGLLRSRGNDADALACYRASLAARATAAAVASSSPSSPSSSPSVLSLAAASTANNAAVLLAAAGARAAALGDAEAASRKYREAESLYEQVSKSRELLLGSDDPAVASALFNRAALACRRGLRAVAREELQRAAAVREIALGERSAELAEVHAALALWSVVGGGRERSAKSSLSSSSSLCLSKREARAHARAALAVFLELIEGENNSAVRGRHAERVAQLRAFLGES